jgi:hypothetical protein
MSNAPGQALFNLSAGKRRAVPLEARFCQIEKFKIAAVRWGAFCVILRFLGGRMVRRRRAGAKQR